MSFMKKQILILGQGTIGTFIGAALSAAGNTVVHYVRNSDHAREKIELDFFDRRKNPYKIKRGTWYTYQFLNSLAEAGNCDYIFVPVGHQSWRLAIESLLPYLHTQQILVLSGNVWGDFDWFKAHIPVPYVFAFPNFGGAIVDGRLQGWLTPHFTAGICMSRYFNQLQTTHELLSEAGFYPKLEQDIRGWLMTHFAYCAGMLEEAALQNGFSNVSKKWSSICTMYRRIRYYLSIAEQQGVNTQAFSEGKQARQPIWWNAFKTGLIFLLPGMAKSADAALNIEEWLSYGQKLERRN